MEQTVSLGVITKDEITQSNFDSHPFFVFKSGPNVMRRGDGVLVGTKDDLRLLVVDMHRTKEEDKTGEGGVRRDRLEPVIVKIGQHHLRLVGSKNLLRTRRLERESRLDKK